MVDDTEQQCGLAVTDDFKDFLCDFITEAVAGMLVNGFQQKDKPQEDTALRNLTVIRNSLPDLLRKAPQK